MQINDQELSSLKSRDTVHVMLVISVLTLKVDFTKVFFCQPAAAPGVLALNRVDIYQSDLL